ncbi:DUF4097 family beta strand repeat-containing protein [Helicobacter ailurogastricus]|uniref:DUF4097 family beta strand repeat-containing protein n=1 Tax=Helicobacter ailurogastricus TaxID=1578720 RepID=UPI000CF0BBD5|nr:DUF4097 family beta strand repeat-containing protein [Helicobacter ailurogastricus]
MEKTFEFKTRDLEIKFGLKMEIEVLTTEQKEPYALFKSEANEADLLIQHSEHSLYITTPEDEELVEEIKGIRSIGDAFALLMKKGLQGDCKVSGWAKIYLPVNHIALYLSANNANVAVNAPIERLELKLNNGSVSVKSAIKNFKAKVNSGDLFLYEPLDTCQIKANNGTIELQAGVRALEIKINNGNIQLGHSQQNIETCQIKANNAQIDAQALIQDLDLRMNNGGIKLVAHEHVKLWDIQSNGANITLKKNGVNIALEDSRGSIGSGRVRLKTSGFVNIVD